MTDLAQRLINAANCVGYGGSLNGGAVHKELLNECRYALEAKDIEIAKYKALCDQMGIALDKVLSTHDYHTDDGAESTCEAIKALDAWKEMK